MVEHSSSDQSTPEMSETDDQEQQEQPKQTTPPRDDTQSTAHFKTVGFIIPDASGAPFGAQSTVPTYTVLPLGNESSRHEVRWRIELENLGREKAVLGIDVVGDVIIGRGAGEPGAPDLDLEPYGAFEQGVSRHHAMLRPTRNSLYLIDLNSTNGTWHNALRLGSGFTHALGSNDTISLGRFTFTVKIIDRPPLDVRAQSSTSSTLDDSSMPPASEISNNLPKAKEDTDLPTPPFGNMMKSQTDSTQEDSPKND